MVVEFIATDREITFHSSTSWSGQDTARETYHKHLNYNLITWWTNQTSGQTDEENGIGANLQPKTIKVNNLNKILRETYFYAKTYIIIKISYW